MKFKLKITRKNVVESEKFLCLKKIVDFGIEM